MSRTQDYDTEPTKTGQVILKP